MDAVLGVDHEPRIGLGRLVAIDDLIDPRRAVKPRRLAVFGQVDADRDRRIQQLQVGRLVLGMVGVGDEHRRQLVERQLAVRLRIGDRLVVGGQAGRGGVGLVVLQRRDRRQAAQEGAAPHVEHAQRPAQRRAELGQQGLGVPDDRQLLVDPALFEGGLVFDQFVARAPGLNGLVSGVGGQHAGLHGVVAALDAGHVHEAGRTTDQHAAGEAQLRDRLQAALGDGARAVGDACSALQVLGDLGVVLEALELVERRQERVLVVQVNHIADGHVAIAEVIQEAAAAGVFVQRPAGGVLG